MRQVHGFRVEGKKAKNRLAHFLWLKLGRRSGREDERARIDIEFSVGKTEHVASKDASGFLINNTNVMPRMSWRIEAETVSYTHLDVYKRQHR